MVSSSTRFSAIPGRKFGFCRFLILSICLSFTLAFSTPQPNPSAPPSALHSLLHSSPAPYPPPLSSNSTSARLSRRKRVGPLSITSPAPPLATAPRRRVALFVEPTPFTHVSGYANRFNEMLRYMAKAGDEVSVLTTDDSNSQPDTAHG